MNTTDVHALGRTSVGKGRTSVGKGRTSVGKGRTSVRPYGEKAQSIYSR
jgi:hypothetical protein